MALSLLPSGVALGQASTTPRMFAASTGPAAVIERGEAFTVVELPLLASADQEWSLSVSFPFSRTTAAALAAGISVRDSRGGWRRLDSPSPIPVIVRASETRPREIKLRFRLAAGVPPEALERIRLLMQPVFDER